MAAPTEAFNTLAYFEVCWLGHNVGPKKILMSASVDEDVGTALSRHIPDENLMVCAVPLFTQSLNSCFKFFISPSSGFSTGYA